MEDSALLRYSRHLLLEPWGAETQERLTRAHVLIVGVGGLGSPASLYLAAAGVGTLTLCDGDVVDLTNLQRQIALASSDVGRLKVKATAERLQQLNPTIDVRVDPRKVAPEAWGDRLGGVDLVLDCCDDFATRFALNRACQEHGIPLVSGAVIRFSAQISVFDFRQKDTPCYACLYPPESWLEEEERCALLGVFSPLAGTTGTLQAGEAIKVLTGVGNPLVGRVLLLDGLSSEFRTVRLLRDPLCSVCGCGARGADPNPVRDGSRRQPGPSADEW
ncbi:MAG: HesA/MoeB/ThiF family protein [Ferrovum myxofaciens]|uniref:HesA/MoeB/ThiF family protein n=1 Tax=Ferrovum myxofaciens TaxID=416213 RepID=UPI002354AE11|nr:HesA/MoeB/ThiF family protein [Ferrovum myxofaciens]QKE42032.1 MAG: HesA/MoeB/ThiF family protein [Ferrovum myxofaciens]